MLFSLMFACLVDHDLYHERRAELTDSDGDGYSAFEGDCDDSNPAVHPESTEVCNDVDDNCDGVIDLDAVDLGGWFPDSDGDGYGDLASESDSCVIPDGWTEQGGDCDDTDANINPDGTEVCNSADDDCDGQVDEDATDMSTWYSDADGDGYGQADKTTEACLQPAGTADLTGDCDDTDAEVSPAATETCNDGIDNDCDGNASDCGWASFIDLTEEMKIFGSYDGSMSRGIAVGDLTGNGQNELILGAYYALDPRDSNTDGMLAIFESPITEPSQTSSQADVQIWGDEDGLGQSVMAGDFDGDGYTDLLASAFSWDGNNKNAIGRNFIMYGPITDGFEVIDSYDWQLQGTQDGERLGQYVHNLGDVSGDGSDDFLLASPFGMHDGIDAPGVAYLFTHTDSGVDIAEDVAQAMLWSDDQFDYFGFGAHSIDLDGDGSLELLLSASGADYGDGAVYLYEGPGLLSGTLTSVDADEKWAGESNSSTGVALDTGDLDGDGRDDFLVVGSTAQDGSAYLVFGESAPSGFDLSDASVTIRGENSPRELFSVLTEDFNGDGVADVLLGEDNGPPANLYVFYGPFGEQATLYTDEADVLLTADNDDDNDFATFGFGDVTGDGVGDAIIGSRYGDGGNGVAYILPGMSQ